MNDINQTDDTTTQTSPDNGNAGMNPDYDLDLILDMPLNVRVELGQAKMLVNELLQLGLGSIVELNKKVGDNLDIYISDKLVAKGEVVVVDEKFGIRLTDIVSPSERVKTLG
jgi:flagellar motor switch protein FliN/FliY